MSQPTWLGFVEIWLGSLRQRLPLPSSWEELLEWGALLSSWKLISHYDRRNGKQSSSDSSPCLPSMHSVERCGLEFRPVVDANVIDQVDRLPTFSWIERAVFYHRNVRSISHRPVSNGNIGRWYVSSFCF